MKTKDPQNDFLSSPAQAIRDLLLKKKNKSSSYSASALARDLGLSAPFLSQVMSGKRNLSLEQKIKLADTLGIDLDIGRQQKTKTNISKVGLLQNSIEHEKILKYWYHFAILELAQTKSNSANPKKIASKLSISELEAKIALDRLLEFGYVLITKDGKIKRTKLLFIFDPKRSSAALRAFHQTRLDHAQNELNQFSEDEVKNRNFQTLFIATSKANIESAKQMIAKFTDELMQRLAHGPQEEVFQFSSQFFSIENKTKSKTNKPEENI